MDVYKQRPTFKIHGLNFFSRNTINDVHSNLDAFDIGKT